MKKVLIYGYGNPGRQDDALGILLAEELEKWTTKNNLGFIDFDSNYQLNIEDALAISNYDVVIFADASIEDIADYTITKVQPSQKTEFTMHAMNPGFVLHLCQSLYDRHPDTFLVHLKGYKFDFLGEITGQANQNLKFASKVLKKILSDQEKIAHQLRRISSEEEEKAKIGLS